jgi:hypothetical protein
MKKILYIIYLFVFTVTLNAADIGELQKKAGAGDAQAQYEQTCNTKHSFHYIYPK